MVKVNVVVLFIINIFIIIVLFVFLVFEITYLSGKFANRVLQWPLGICSLVYYTSGYKEAQ